MTETRSGAGMSRRQALKATTGLVGGAVVAAAAPWSAVNAWAAGSEGRSAATTPAAGDSTRGLPVKEIERIIKAKGTVSNGVLNIQVDRTDLPHVVKMPENIPIKPGFEINGNLCFQTLPDGSTMFNGDLAFRPAELNPAISQAVAHGIAWQAFHQHLFNLSPMVWFMHFRAHGDPERIAKGIAAILSVTSTPLPQAPPAHPKTPLDAARLGRIIGATPTVGSDGVVSMEVPRANPITLGGFKINPYLNIYTSVDFQPLAGGMAVAVPDFGMTFDEIPAVARVMQGAGWQINCLYNQETDEHPQLYFSHQLKVGDPVTLAREIRAGLEQTDVKLQ